MLKVMRLVLNVWGYIVSAVVSCKWKTKTKCGRCHGKKKTKTTNTFPNDPDAGGYEVSTSVLRDYYVRVSVVAPGKQKTKELYVYSTIAKLYEICDKHWHSKICMECFGDFVGRDNFNNFIIFICLVAYCVKDQMRAWTWLKEDQDYKYCKRVFFRWGKISQKCWQDISRGGNFHDTTPISFIKTYGFYFSLWVIFAKKRKARKTRKLPPRENFHVYSMGFALKHNLQKIELKILMSVCGYSRLVHENILLSGFYCKMLRFTEGAKDNSVEMWKVVTFSWTKTHAQVLVIDN